MTPRLLAIESRPFLVEPEPFLWAASMVRRKLVTGVEAVERTTTRWPAMEDEARPNILATEVDFAENRRPWQAVF